MSVLAELRNRGVADVLICCCDGLSGLPEANHRDQTCGVHLMRASLRYASKKDHPPSWCPR
jgi:putative transposase